MQDSGKVVAVKASVRVRGPDQIYRKSIANIYNAESEQTAFINTTPAQDTGYIEGEI